MRKKSNIPFDGMQKYMTVGEYNVGAPEGTPHGEEYKLIVIKILTMSYTKLYVRLMRLI